MSKSLASKLIVPVLVLLGLVSVVMLKIGAIFILMALMPSVIAYYIDQTRDLHIMKTVLACNIASTLPAIYPMLKAAYLFEPFNAFDLLADPMNWLIAYLGAAFGWALIYLCRFIARLMVIVAYEYQIHDLKRMQKALIEEWGKEIELTAMPTEEEK